MTTAAASSCLPIAKSTRLFTTAASSRGHSPPPMAPIAIPVLATPKPVTKSRPKDLRKEVLLKQFYYDLEKQGHGDSFESTMVLPTVSLRVTSSRHVKRRRAHPDKHCDYLTAHAARHEAVASPEQEHALSVTVPEARAERIIHARIDQLKDRLRRVYSAACSLQQAALVRRLPPNRAWQDSRTYFTNEYHALSDFAVARVPGWEAELETLLDAVGLPAWDRDGWRAKMCLVMNSIQVIVAVM
ncbi:hypothetical protein MIND_01108200 [Mycena indigotica]|uniref:Uncharacterized protein n=1 Tax=Mycena indigotica TaxID=2126181 RepID=A0A8H6VVN7_9AGAR|nr:uncharacterized protein MIND_01108200 [Mycena indigotica]KAF7295679.1 hypothetical protein MIND_01108200 [Mycena indigotica]